MSTQIGSFPPICAWRVSERVCVCCSVCMCCMLQPSALFNGVKYVAYFSIIFGRCVRCNYCLCLLITQSNTQWFDGTLEHYRSMMFASKSIVSLTPLNTQMVTVTLLRGLDASQSSVEWQTTRSCQKQQFELCQIRHLLRKSIIRHIVWRQGSLEPFQKINPLMQW